MDLYLLIILPIFGVLSGYFIKFIPELLTRCLLSIVEIINEKIVEDIDDFIIQNPDVNYTENYKKIPMNIWYLVWGWFPLILVRCEADKRGFLDGGKYLLYGRRKNIDSFLNKVRKNIENLENNQDKDTQSTKRRIEVYYRENSGVNLFNQLLPKKALPGQQKVLDFVQQMYQNRINDEDSDFPKHSLSVILFGEPGVGKSSVARLLTYELKARLILGCDLTDPQFRMREIYSKMVKSTTIMVFDEIDKTFETADNGRERGVNRSLARNKQSLTGFLDRMEFLDDYIIFATTNRKYEEMEVKYPWYMRKGRFDIKITMTPDNIVIHD
jgi:hypothetical protein